MKTLESGWGKGWHVTGSGLDIWPQHQVFGQPYDFSKLTSIFVSFLSLNGYPENWKSSPKPVKMLVFPPPQKALEEH